MSKNYEKDFFEHFEDPSQGQPVDPLSDLYADNGQTDEFVELCELILRYQDGDISQTQFSRMQNWILSDCKALKFYVEYVWLCAGLTLLFRKKQDKSFLERLFAFCK